MPRLRISGISVTSTPWRGLFRAGPSAGAFGSPSSPGRRGCGQKVSKATRIRRRPSDDTPSRLPPRPLRDPLASRRGRDGRGLSRKGPDARPRGRHQSAPASTAGGPEGLGRFEEEARPPASSITRTSSRSTASGRRGSPTSRWSSSRARRCASCSPAARSAAERSRSPPSSRRRALRRARRTESSTGT